MMKTTIKFLLIVFGLGVLSVNQDVAFAQAQTKSTNQESLKNWCAKMTLRIREIRFEADALSCASFYFMHQELESEQTPFNHVLNFTLRATEINPRNYNSQLSVLWLNYSHWVMFRENPSYFARYRNSLSVALVWADRIERSFSTNELALADLAKQLYPIGVYYDVKLLPRVLRLMLESEALTRHGPTKIRRRLDIAHLYRRMGNIPLAIESYYWVLKISPENKIAKKFLADLEARHLLIGSE